MTRPSHSEAEQARLAAALRANLRRRKAAGHSQPAAGGERAKAAEAADGQATPARSGDELP